MACRITTEQILEMLDEDLDVGLNMEYGEDEETDSDVDNAYLKERIWDDLEYNENNELDNSFNECSRYNSSSDEASDIKNNTGNSYEQSCVRGCGDVVQLKDEQDVVLLEFTVGRGTNWQSSSGTSRGDVDPRGRRGATVGQGHGRRQSTTQDMNFDWTVISSG